MRVTVTVREVRFKSATIEVDDEDTITEAAAELDDSQFDDESGGSWEVVSWDRVAEVRNA